MANIADMLGKSSTKEEIKAVSDLVALVLKEAGIADYPQVKAVTEGLTPAQAMGLTRRNLDAIYAVAFNRLMAGDAKAAADAFGYLALIDPLHAPNHYCNAVALLELGRIDDAENSVVVFLALDATNPVGYLRWGDISMRKGDKARAAELYRLAEAECRNGHGDQVTLLEARSKLSFLNEEIAG